MFSRALGLGLAFVAVLVFGLFIGYTLKPSVNVEVYDPASMGPPPPSITRNHRLPKDLGENPVVASAFEKCKSWRPLVKAGPFDLYSSPKTSGYMIVNSDDHQPVLLQETADDRTELSFWGKCGEISVDLTYDRITGKRIRSQFQCNGEGGFLAPTKWIYRDDNGDGRIDCMVDCEAGVVYKQEGLKWVEIRRRRPVTVEKPPESSHDLKDENPFE